MQKASSVKEGSIVNNVTQVNMKMPGPKSGPGIVKPCAVAGNYPRRPQLGQAPMPWLFSTLLATRICSDLLAV